jgi:hypothetical protein
MDCIYVEKAEYAGDFTVRLRFNDGKEGLADLKDLIFKYEAAAPLRTPEAFSKFQLDSWPTLAWECGFDVAPESLYERCQPGMIAAEEPAEYTTRKDQDKK